MLLLAFKKSLLICVVISNFTQWSAWWLMLGKGGRLSNYLSRVSTCFSFFSSSPSFFPKMSMAKGRKKSSFAIWLSASLIAPHLLHHVRVVYKGHLLRPPGWTLWPHCWITFPENAKRSNVTFMNFWTSSWCNMLFSFRLKYMVSKSKYYFQSVWEILFLSWKN